MQPNTASFTARSSSTIDLWSSQSPAVWVSIGQDTTAMLQIGWQWLLRIETWNIVKHLTITIKHRALLLPAAWQFGNEALRVRNTILPVLRCMTPSTCMYVCMHMYICIYLFIYLFIYVFIYLFSYLFVCLVIYLFIYLFILFIWFLFNYLFN